MYRRSPASRWEKQKALDLRKQGVSVAEIARRLDRSDSAIRTWCQLAGFYTPKRRATASEILKVLDLSRKGHTFNEIAERTGWSSWLVGKWVNNPGIVSLRARDDAQLEAKKQKAIRLYREGQAVTRISRVTRTCVVTVRSWLKEAGLEDTLPPPFPGPKLQERAQDVSAIQFLSWLCSTWDSRDELGLETVTAREFARRAIEMYRSREQGGRP